MKWWLLAFVGLLGCGTNQDGPWILKESKYYNNEVRNVEYAQAWFNPVYKETRTDWAKATSFRYYDSLEDIEKICQAPAYGCMVAFYQFVIYDSPDDYLRCTIIQHELGHMGAFLYGAHTGDYNHTENQEYFNNYIFDVCYTIVEENDKEKN